MEPRQQGRGATCPTVLGSDASNEALYEISCQEYGRQDDGMHYDCVTISPLDDADQPEQPKTVQVTHKYHAKVEGNLAFSTVAVHETLAEVDDCNTVSKIVRLSDNLPREQEKREEAEENEDESEIFASDPEALKYFKLAGQAQNSSTVPKMQASAGTLASDDEALKGFKVFRSDDPQEGEEGEIFASDPETLKLINLMKKPQAEAPVHKDAFHAVEDEDEDEGVFASDPEALKFLKLMKKPKADDGSSHSAKDFVADNSAAGASDQPEEDAIFASDPDALKFLKLVPMADRATGGTAACDPNAPGFFATDAEGPERRPQTPPSTPTGERPQQAELLAEATNVELKRGASFTVRVSGQQLPNGLQKKVVDVSSNSGVASETVDVDKLQVSVEEKVNSNGTVEKFVVVE